MKAKSNFDDLGVFGLLVIWATTFILGVWGHVVEEVVKNLGFLHFFTKILLPEGSKIQTNGSRKKLCSHDNSQLALKIIYSTPTLF